VCATAMINHAVISFSAVQIYDLSYSFASFTFQVYYLIHEVLVLVIIIIISYRFMFFF